VRGEGDAASAKRVRREAPRASPPPPSSSSPPPPVGDGDEWRDPIRQARLAPPPPPQPPALLRFRVRVGDETLLVLQPRVDALTQRPATLAAVARAAESLFERRRRRRPEIEAMQWAGATVSLEEPAEALAEAPGGEAATLTACVARFVTRSLAQMYDEALSGPQSRLRSRDLLRLVAAAPERADWEVRECGAAPVAWRALWESLAMDPADVRCAALRVERSVLGDDDGVAEAMAHALAAAPGVFGALHTLQLRCCGLGAAAAAAVLAAVPSLPALRTLDLSLNPLTDAAVPALAAALPYARALISLALEATALRGDDAGGWTLVHALRRAPRLAELDLSRNAWTDETLRQLLRLPHWCTALRVLRVDGVARAGAAALSALAQLCGEEEGEGVENKESEAEAAMGRGAASPELLALKPRSVASTASPALALSLRDWGDGRDGALLSEALAASLRAPQSRLAALDLSHADIAAGPLAALLLAVGESRSLRAIALRGVRGIAGVGADAWAAALQRARALEAVDARDACDDAAEQAQLRAAVAAAADSVREVEVAL
jgi:hypothetical protein